MYKVVSYFLASLFAALVFSPSMASALSLTSLDQISEPSENIEIQVPPAEGYDFDATFLAKQETLQFKATVTNDDDTAIKITSIDINTPANLFFEYSYTGIAVNDEIAAGDSVEVFVTVSINNLDTVTTSEDFLLNINYEKVTPEPEPTPTPTPTPDPTPTPTPDPTPTPTPDPTPSPTPDPEPTPTPTPDDTPTNPETATGSIVTGSIILIGAIIVGFFVLRKNSHRRTFVLLLALPLAGLILLSTRANAEETLTLSIKGKISFVNIYTVTIDPDGGVYNDTTAPTTLNVREGEEIQVGAATRDTYNFLRWDLDTGELDNENKIEVHSDIYIKAIWDEIWYNLTIDPNGGAYNGELTSRHRAGESVDITTPSYEGHTFTSWLKNGTDFTGSHIVMTEDTTLVAQWDDIYFDVTINPNGGKYNNSESTWTGRVKYGNSVDLSNTTWADHEITHWTQNGNEIAADTGSVAIYEDTDFVANWQSTIFHTVTIIPNGGKYNNSTETQTYSVRLGDSYTMLTADRDDGYALDYWTDDNGDRFDQTSFAVEEDITLTAHWFKIVARIERTQKLYPSIMSAHNEAQSNDIITLLVNTEEVVRNEKKVTLDLNYHTVTGYLYNTGMGDITLINGEINNYNSPIRNEENPSAAAVVNAGKLTMGIDDYQDGDSHTKAANILRDNIRAIGSDYGIAQNGEFYFYDGFIEGDIGLAGGYNGSPWFRSTFDGVEIHYFPFVDHNNEKNCQHVELENSDRAVSKTIDNGEIYYYNLQDNINTSALTGYDIYAVRNFEATYSINAPANITTNFDTYGYDIQFGDNLTIDGDLIITNSQSADHISKLDFSRTITNNGTLSFSDVSAEAISANDLIHSNKNLILNNVTLSSTLADVIVTSGDSATITSTNAQIISTATNKYALHNYATDLAVAGGDYSGSCIIINNEKDASITIDGGSYSSEAGTSSCSVIRNYSTATINDGNISSTGTAAYAVGINNYSTLIMNGGNISVETTSNNSSSYAYGIRNEQNSSYGISTATINGGTISAKTNAGSAQGINGRTVTINEADGNSPTINAEGRTTYIINAATATINGGTFSSTAQNIAYGVYAPTSTITGGDFTVASTSQQAYGIYETTKTTISGGNISVTSVSGNAYGVYSSVNDSTINIHGGNISAATQDPTKIGSGVDTGNRHITVNITDGEIYGSTYGINASGTTVSAPVNIGDIERPLYNGVSVDDHGDVYPAKPQISGGVYGVYSGYINFYDGIVRGHDSHFDDMANIKAIPSGTSYDFGESDSYEHACWLIDSINYLRIDGVGEFNSLDDAYNAAQDGDIIEVIHDFQTEAVLPTNVKNVTLDLKGHTLTCTQPLLNDGTLTIKDSSPEQAGAIINTNPGVYAIENNTPANSASATLNIESGNITGSCNVIYSKAASSNLRTNINLTGGTITSSSEKATCYVVHTYNPTNITIDNATITNNANPINTELYGIYLHTGSITMNGGKIDVISARQSYGISVISTTGKTITMNGGEIIAEATNTNNGDAVGIDANTYTNITLSKLSSTAPIITTTGHYATGIDSGRTVIVNDAVITSNADNRAYGVGNGENVEIRGGTITSEANTTAYGIYNNNTIKINGGNISANSINGNSVGVGVLNTTYGTLTMTNGTIRATKPIENTTGTSTGIDIRAATITGGSVHGDTYGMNSKSPSNSNSFTLGENDLGATDFHSGTDGNAPQPYISGGVYAINNGYINFFDGKLHGGSAYVDSAETIKAIPTNATYHFENETETSYEDCWLEEAIEYLQIGDTKFNSLTAAFNAAQNGDIIEVIADYSTEAVHEPNTKNVTLDLHGHHLIYTQPVINGSNGTLTVTDLSERKDGTLISTNITSSKPTILNEGTLIVDGGHISSSFYAISNSGSFTFNDGLISTIGEASGAAAVRNTSTMHLVGGTIRAEAPNGEADLAGVYGSGSSNYLEGTDIIVSGKSSCYGFRSSNSPTAIVTGGNITVTSSDSTARGISAYHSRILKSDDPDSSAPVITVIAKNTAYGVSGSYAYSVVETGTISATSTDADTYGVSGVGEVTGGTITANAKTTARGVSGYRQTISDATIIANSTNGNAYASDITSYNCNNYVNNITSGHLSATTTGDGKLGIGVNVSTCDSLTVTGGEIYGNTYGIYTGTPESSARKIIIGNDDGVFNNGFDDELLLTIRGGTVGVYGGNTYFYDGQIKGVDHAYFDRNVKGIATDAAVYLASETIDSQEYEVKYVAAEHPVVRIDSTEYPSIAKALDNAQPGDTITLLEDNYVFYPLTFDDTDNVTLELDGYTIITGNQVTNNGNVTIQDSKAGVTPVLSYHETNAFITNNGNLTVKDVDLDARNVITATAGSSTTLENVHVTHYDISGDNYLITNRGDLTVNNSIIESPYHTIDHYTGALNITDSTLTSLGSGSSSYSTLHINSGTANIARSTLTTQHQLTSGNYLALYQTGESTVTTVSDNTVFNGAISINDGSFSMQDSVQNRIIERNNTSLSIGSNATAAITNSTLNYNYGNPFISNSGNLSLTSVTAIISSSSRTESRIITNSGNLTIDHTELAYIVEEGLKRDDSPHYGINSTAGTVNILNGSSILIDIPTIGDHQNYGAYVKAGSLNIDGESTITVNTDGNRTNYGIYIENSDTDEDKGVRLTTGSISVEGSRTAYGVYINDGRFTMGEKETDPALIGGPVANLEKPVVRAIGTTSGTGIKKLAGGFYFYDGKIIGSTEAKPEIASATEYLHETKETQGEDGYFYCILDWIRQTDGDTAQP